MVKAIKDIVNPIDPSKITGPYALLAVFLLVLQVSIGVWFAAANSGTERVVAGLIFAALFASFLYSLLRLQGTLQRTSTALSEQTGKISTEDIAKEEVAQDQIESPEPQLLTAPDGSFDIHEPPADWYVKELTLSEWMNENLLIRNPSPEEEFEEANRQERSILVFEAQRRTIVTPVPGITRSEGRLLPSALELAIPTRLAIVPLERYEPPIFVERSLRACASRRE